MSKIFNKFEKLPRENYCENFGNYLDKFRENFCYSKYFYFRKGFYKFWYMVLKMIREIFEKFCGYFVKTFNLEILEKFQRSFEIILLKFWKKFVRITKKWKF